MLNKFFENYKLQINFIIVGTVNALIYLSIIYFIDLLYLNHYFSVLIGQFLMAIISYLNFTLLTFKMRMDKIIFFKYIICQILLYAISSLVALMSIYLKLNRLVFLILIILFATPVSYLMNKHFVFKIRGYAE